jgi:hypothetical protein
LRLTYRLNCSPFLAPYASSVNTLASTLKPSPSTDGVAPTHRATPSRVVNSFDDNKVLLAPPPFLPELLFSFSILWLQPTDQTGRISDRTSYAPCLSLVVYCLIATLYYPPGSPYSPCLCGSPSPTTLSVGITRSNTARSLEPQPSCTCDDYSTLA